MSRLTLKFTWLEYNRVFKVLCIVVKPILQSCGHVHKKL